MDLDVASRGIGMGIGIAATGIGIGIAFDQMKNLQRGKSRMKNPPFKPMFTPPKHFKVKW